MRLVGESRGAGGVDRARSGADRSDRALDADASGVRHRCDSESPRERTGERHRMHAEVCGDLARRERRLPFDAPRDRVEPGRRRHGVDDRCELRQQSAEIARKACGSRSVEHGRPPSDPRTCDGVGTNDAIRVRDRRELIACATGSSIGADGENARRAVDVEIGVRRPSRLDQHRTRSEQTFMPANALEHATGNDEGEGIVGVDVLALARVRVVTRFDDAKRSEARIESVALHAEAPRPTGGELRSCGASSREF
jgi:hypothetical protein